MYDRLEDDGTRAQLGGTEALREERNPLKGRYDLIPPASIKRLAVHFALGAKKYSERNWEQGLPLSTFSDSASRHLAQFQAGENDEDHLAAVLWNVVCLMETARRIEEGKLPPELHDLGMDWYMTRHKAGVGRVSTPEQADAVEPAQQATEGVQRMMADREVSQEEQEAMEAIRRVRLLSPDAILRLMFRDLDAKPPIDGMSPKAPGAKKLHLKRQ